MNENHHLIDTSFLLERSREEIGFVKQDMACSIAYFKNQLSILKEVEVTNPHLSGYCIRQHKLEDEINHLIALFDPFEASSLSSPVSPAPSNSDKFNIDKVAHFLDGART